jgi:RND family efflux transporter MFP subunit
VRKGDVIAVLVKDLLLARQELLKAEAERYASVVTTRHAEIELRQQELRRIEKLKQSAAFSKARLDDKRQEVVVSESQLAEAEAMLAGALANLKLTEINLSYATVRAPYSGVVSKRHTEVGSFVGLGDPLISLIDDKNMEIEADVPANRTAGLRPGTVIAVDLAGGRRIESEVRAVVPEENSQTRTRIVRFSPKLGGNGGGLAVNQSVTLHVPAGASANGITVHKDAVLIRNGIKMVFVVGAGKAEIRPVSLGEAVGNRFVVNKGLKQGDLVVVRGNERLRPGQSVSYPGQPELSSQG